VEHSSIKAWLSVRGEESVRIVLEGTSLLVYGPGPRFSSSRFADGTEAMLRHAAVQRELLAEGWTRDSTHDRRTGVERRRESRGPDRRQILRLVSDRDKGGH
jgi:hypothetical protein